MLLLLWRLRRSRIGRAFEAIKDRDRALLIGLTTVVMVAVMVMLVLPSLSTVFSFDANPPHRRLDKTCPSSTKTPHIPDFNSPYRLAFYNFQALGTLPLPSSSYTYLPWCACGGACS